MKKWIPSRIYVRTFLIQTLILLALTIPFSFYLSNQFQEYAYSQIGQHVKNKANQTIDNSTFMLDRLKSFSLNMYENQEVQKWLLLEQQDVLTEIGMMSIVNQLLVNESFVDKIYLINTRTQRIFDSKKGIVGFDRFQDPNFLDTVLNHRPEYLNFIDYQVGSNKYLMLIVPSVPSNKSYYGYLVVLLDANMFQKFILGTDQKNGIEVMIVNDAGEIILGSSNSALSQAVSTRYKRGEVGSAKQTLNGIKWNMESRHLTGQKWHVIYMERMDLLQKDMKSLQNRMIYVSLSLIVVLLSIFFWNLRRGYKPVRNLADRIYTKLNVKAVASEEAIGEIQMIEQGVDRLFESVHNLSSSVEEQQKLLKEEYLRQWILQGKLSVPLQTNIESTSHIAASGHLYMSVCRIDSYRAFMEKYNFDSRKLLKYSMANIAGELIARKGWMVESIDFGSDHLVFIIGSQTEIIDSISSVLKEIQTEIERYLHIRTTIALSDSKPIDCDMRAVYDHIYELTMLKFISVDNRIYREKDYEDYQNLMSPVSDEELLDKLLKAIRLGLTAEVSEILDTLFEGMKSLTYLECRYKLVYIIYTFMKAFSQLAPLQSFNGISKQLDRFSTLFEVREWLESEIVKIISCLNQRNGSNRKEEFVAEMMQFIKINIHNPTLNIEDIASHISLSVSYVRAIFKEVLNTTIADYILKERIERTKELLVTQKWSIADIAEQSGFLTKSNFYTVFKKVTGFTPNEYRRSHQNEK